MELTFVRGLAETKRLTGTKERGIRNSSVFAKNKKMYLIEWLALLCCWCCDRTDGDEREYETEEQARRQAVKNIMDVDDANAKQTQKRRQAGPPPLFHGPDLHECDD
jgi:hypothetical protein